jgi:uncharacterized protein GlcG (DUF336 family)
VKTNHQVVFGGYPIMADGQMVSGIGVIGLDPLNI